MNGVIAESPILVSCKAGWAYDHCKAISGSVAGSGYRCPTDLFDVRQPYSFCSTNNVPRGNEVCPKHLTGTKRKWSDEETQTQHQIEIKQEISLEQEAREIVMFVQHSNLVNWMSEILKGFFSTLKCIRDSIDFVGLSDLAKHCHAEDDVEEVYNIQVGNRGIVDIISKVVKNSSQSCVLIDALGAKFLIPASSTFLMSDLTDIGKLLNIGQKYDFIVIDPPWSNKSVKRARNYKSLSFNSIKALPVPQLASPAALVAIWITNKKKVIDFATKELFPYWSLQLIGKWYWVKVTVNGEFVYNFQSTHKRPYECLLIGYLKKSRSSENLQSHHQGEDFPFHKIICSVPCRLHSRKPMLFDFLREFLPKDPKCLELFARNLTPGWTSWGNEVLKYQKICYFEPCPKSH